MENQASHEPVELKIPYIGGGSREWARKLMLDLALCPDLTGQVVLLWLLPRGLWHAAPAQRTGGR